MAFEMLLVALIWGFSSVPVQVVFSKRIFFSCQFCWVSLFREDFDSVACNGIQKKRFFFSFFFPLNSELCLRMAIASLLQIVLVGFSIREQEFHKSWLQSFLFFLFMMFKFN